MSGSASTPPGNVLPAPIQIPELPPADLPLNPQDLMVISQGDIARNAPISSIANQLVVKDATETVSNVGTIVVTGGTVNAGGTNEAELTIVAAASIAVTDGTTTVIPVSTVNFTTGATVTDGGSGEAKVAIDFSSVSLTVKNTGTVSIPNTTTLTAGGGTTLTSAGSNQATITVATLNVNDGTTTVDPTTKLTITKGAVITDAGSGEAKMAIAVADTLVVTDGTTTVSDTKQIDFTNAQVTSGGSGKAGVIIPTLTVNQGTVTIVPTTTIALSGSGVTTSDGGGGKANVTISAASALVVTDGTTTVNPTGTITMVGSAVVTDLGGGDAQINVNGTLAGSGLRSVVFSFGGTAVATSTDFPVAIQQAGTLVANAAGAAGYCEVPPATDIDFLLQVNSGGTLSSLGTITINTGGTVAFPSFAAQPLGSDDTDAVIVTTPADFDGAEGISFALPYVADNGGGPGGGTVLSVSGSAPLNGTVTSTGTIGLNYGNGLHVTSSTLEADWNGGTVNAIGSGLTLATGTLSATGGGGSVTSVVAGPGLNGGTITVSGTLTANYQAGTLTTFGPGLTLASNTLTADWRTTAVTALNSSLAVTSGTLGVTGTTEPYTLGIFVPGTMTNSQTLALHQFPLAVTFPSNFGASTLGGSSKAGSGVNATSSTTILISQCPAASDPTNGANFTNIGTVIIGAGGHAGTLTTSGTVAFASGDFLRFMGPGTADATLANFFATLVGNR